MPHETWSLTISPLSNELFHNMCYATYFLVLFMVLFSVSIKSEVQNITTLIISSKDQGCLDLFYFNNKFVKIIYII